MNVMVIAKNEARRAMGVDRSPPAVQIEAPPVPVCGKRHSNLALTVVRVFQTGFAREIRYVDVSQTRCLLGTYRRHHRADGVALSDDQLGRPRPPSGGFCGIPHRFGTPCRVAD